MKTYTESMDLKPFDWHKFLKKPRLSPRIRHRAANWPTCACGSQCAIIPRYQDGEPYDRLLSIYGMRFYYAIRDQDWGTAKLTLAKIEHRSVVLLAKMRKEKRK